MVKITGVYHVGMVAKDPAALAAFYRDVLGMTVTGGSDAASPFGTSAFLSSRPDDENHEIAFFTEPMFKHTALKVASLADLRAAYHEIKERGIPIKFTFNHGCSLAFYFDDPEGNLLEVYWPTAIQNWQPYGDPVDLDASEAVLREEVARVATAAGLPLPEALIRARS